MGFLENKRGIAISLAFAEPDPNRSQRAGIGDGGRSGIEESRSFCAVAPSAINFRKMDLSCRERRQPFESAFEIPSSGIYFSLPLLDHAERIGEQSRSGELRKTLFQLAFCVAPILLLDQWNYGGQISLFVLRGRLASEQPRHENEDDLTAPKPSNPDSLGNQNTRFRLTILPCSE